MERSVERVSICYSIWEYFFTLVGLVFFLLDIALDIYNVVSFYQEGSYVYMGLMIFLLLGSSVLLQVFSSLWYSDSLDNLETKVEKFANRHRLIKPLHFLQLGVFLRYIGLIEITTTQLCCSRQRVSLNLDFQMLSLFEAFSESIPQLTLMMTKALQRGELELKSGLKILFSAVLIAKTVTKYHRSMRAFAKNKMSWLSTGFYFLWILFLITTRVAALALFCSVLPYCIIAHFLSWWMVLVLAACVLKTDYMYNHSWEWLYRATVGLIWYFGWFNISPRNIKLKVVYYSLMALDMMLLLGLWWWKVVEYAGCWSSLYPCIVIPIVAGLYVVGIILKIIYYKWFHSECDEEKLAEHRDEGMLRAAAACPDMNRIQSDSEPAAPAPVSGVHKRCRTMAANFF